MSLKENFDDFVYTVKDSYYALEEKIGFPPLLLAGILALAIIAFFYISIPEDEGEEKEFYNAVFEFRDGMDRPISNLLVSFSVDGNDFEKSTSSSGKAVIRVPEGSSVSVLVEDGEYESYEAAFSIIENGQTESIVLELLEKPPVKKMLRFEDEKGLIKGKRITATLTCEDGRSFRVTDEDMDGLIEVTLPEGCEEARVKTELAGYEEAETGYFGGGGVQLIKLKKKEMPKGSITFRLVDEEGVLLRNTEFSVTIRKNGNELTEEDNYPIIEFKDIPTGTYSVTVKELGNDYVVASPPDSRLVVVEKGKTAEKEIRFSRKTKGTIKVEVKGKESGEAIENAEVILKDASGVVIAQESTGSGEAVEFSLFEEGEYFATAKKAGGIGEGYFPKTVEADLNSEITIELEMVKAGNIGRTIVSVKDEDGKPVRDARVMFRHRETGAIVELAEEENYKLSDVNGEAEFYLGEIDEEIYAYAVKYPAEGGTKEQAKTIEAMELNEFSITMVIGNSTLDLKTINSSGEPLAETYFEVFGQDGESVTGGKIPMTGGETTYELKADKIVYIVFTKDGYMNYQSEEIELWPDETFAITALMRREGEILEPMIEFKGVYENGTETDTLEAGKSYEFKYSLVLPENDTLSEAGFHFRAGEKTSLQDDFIYITKVNAPNSSSVVKARTYTPPTNEANEERASERAKWATIKWLGPENGIYNISIEARVKKETYPNTKLPVYYRAWIAKGTQFVRTPQDEVLGSNESVEGKNALYAKAFEKVFFEGSSPVCEGDFCITGKWLYDRQEDIFLKEPYSLMVSGDYNFIFVLMNNSAESHEGMRIDVKNVLEGDEKHDLKVNSFIFNDANGGFLSQNVDGYEFEVPDLGGSGFVYPADVNFNLSLLPKNVGGTQLKMRVIGDHEVLFEKLFDFRVTVSDEIEMEIEPTEIEPFKETGLEVRLSKKGSGLELEGALVTMTRESPDGLYQVVSKKSGEEGKVSFTVPASIPLTKVSIETSKIAYLPVKEEIIVGEDVLTVQPESLYSSLNTSDKKEETLSVSVKNESGTEFFIKSLSLTGDFKGILNEGAMGAFLANWVGKKILPESEEELMLPKTVLSLNAEDYMKGPETLSGELEIVLANNAFFVDYSYTIPLTVEISLGGSVENSPCVTIDGPDTPDWEATILNNQAVTEFDIRNSCVKGGQKIDVKDLQARLEWQGGGKKAGILELTIFNPDGQPVTEVLRENEWIVFWNEMKRNTFGSYHAVLTYTPKSGYINEEAKFKVYFDAEVSTDQGMVKVNNEGVSLNGSILNLNLDDCISMPGEGEKATIGAGEEEIQIELDASACKADVQIQLCKNDPYCRGGTKEGGIMLSSRDFTLKESSPSKSITVYRQDIPGLYGIPVYARLNNTSLQKVRTIDVLVEPREGMWLSLNRYEAILTEETSWEDTVQLENTAPLDPVEIRAKYCNTCRENILKIFKRDVEIPDECVWNKVLEEEVKKRTWMDSIGYGVGAFAICECLFVIPGCTANITDAVTSTASKAVTGAVSPPQSPCDGVVYFSGGSEEIYFPGKGGQGTEGYQTRGKEITAELVMDPFWGTLICLGAGVGTSLLHRYVLTDNCDWEYQTDIVQDYIIRVEGDTGKRLSFESSDYSAKWGEANNPFGESEAERMPIKLKNTGQSKSAEEEYEVLSVTVTEHIHGDPMHQDPKMTMEDAEFGSYNVPDTDSKEYRQKFHMKFETQERIDIELPPLEDYYSCVSGSKIGVTGKDAKPKVEFNWSWAQDGIALDSCDAENPGGIYCDATQLSIALSKKIHRIDEFLAENNYEFAVPTNPNTAQSSSIVDSMNESQSEHEVEEGEIGLASISRTIDPNALTASFNTVIQNKTGSEANATVMLVLAGSEDYYEECEKTVTVSAGSEKTIECNFSGLSEDDSAPYIATQYIQESTSGSVDETQLKTGFFLQSSVGGDTWLPRSTEKYRGHSVLEYYINKNLPNWEQFVQETSINWPSDWPGSTEEEKIEYLRSLFDFTAKLVKDGYSVDFQKDFAEYYSGTTFFDVPTWFYSGSSDQLADYFSDPERLKFKQKYGSSTTLPGPGTYEVFISIDFGKDNWSLFKEGKPKGNISIEFYRVQEPEMNSVFYYLPFDGKVGIESMDGRQEYGLNYVNGGEEIQVSKSPYPIETTHSAPSNALMTMSTAKKTGLKYLNSEAGSRGNLLSVEVQGNEPLLVFSPSYATPVILKVEEGQGGSAYSEFTLFEDSQAVSGSRNLTYWTGLGECADFSGQPIREAFDFYGDESTAQKSFRISWNEIALGGTVYLYSDFFTPPENAYILKSETDNSKFMTADEAAAESVNLNGISSMESNSRGSGNSVSTIETILEMVEAGNVCVTNSGSKSSFWWNPKALVEAKGNNLSVSEFGQSLLPGKTCIGPE